MNPSWVIVIGSVAVAPVAFAPAAFAQSAPDNANDIVVTAPIEGPRTLGAVEVLTRDQLVETLNGGLGETTDALPGVASTFYGAGASRPVIRGLGDDRVRVLQNGIGAIDAASASPDHAPSGEGLDAERIEVLRGTSALAYGGNAVGGVINLLDGSIPTKRPEAGLTGSAFAGYTSVDEGWQGAATASAAAGPFAVQVSFAGRESDDYEIPGFARSASKRAAEPLPAGTQEPTGIVPNSAVSVRSFGAGASLPGDFGFVGLAVKRFETEYGLPPEEVGSPDGPTIELEQTRVESRGDFNVGFGPFTRVDYGLQWADYEHREIEDTGEVATTFTNKGFEGRADAHHGGFDGRLSGAIGLQFLDTDFDAVGEEAFLTATQTRELGIFAIERWDTGRWGVEGGLRVERRDLDNENLLDRDFTVSSATLGGFLRPAERLFFGATLSRTERAPTQFELYADGPHAATGSYERGDVLLDKETALTIEATARFEGERWRLEGALYRADFSDYIALLDSGLVFDEDAEVIVTPALLTPGSESLPVFDYQARDAVFTGGEFSIAGTLLETGAVTLTGDFEVDVVRAEFDNGGNLPRIPARSLTAGLGATRGTLSARIEAVNVAEQDDIAAFETPTEGYTLLNARLTWHPLGEDQGLRIILDGRNLNDAEAREHVSFLKDELPRPGRSIRLALATRF
jgi:iron complex outermembrane recepter protein